MHTHSKIFFTKKSAEDFIELLKGQGITDIMLWQNRDGQNRYAVRWNMD